MVLLERPAIEPAVRRRLWIDLALFTGAVFAVTWVVVGIYVWDAAWATNLFGPMRLGAPAFYVAVAAPSVVALLLTAWRYGRRGLADLLRALVRVRAGWAWIAIALLGYPLLWLAVALVRALATGEGLGQFDFQPWLVGLPMLLIGGHMLRDPGALGEELGWRGFALPRLLELMDARAASLLLGLVWAVWHLPAFFLSSLSQSSTDFGLFVLNVMAFSVFMTWLFVNMRGSVFWAGVVPHILFNATPKAGIAPVLWVTVAIGVLILLLGGRHLRGRNGPVELPQSALLRAGRGER